MYIASAGPSAMEAYCAAKGKFSNQIVDKEKRTDASYVRRNNPEDLAAFMDLGGTFFDNEGNFLKDREGTPVWNQDQPKEWYTEPTQGMLRPTETKEFILEYRKKHDFEAALGAAEKAGAEIAAYEKELKKYHEKSKRRQRTLGEPLHSPPNDSEEKPVRDSGFTTNLNIALMSLNGPP